jgi:hypothetical protein
MKSTPSTIMQSLLYHIVPEDTNDEDDTSSVEPSATEGSESDWIEIEDKKWTDEELMDDARLGRRRGVGQEWASIGEPNSAVLKRQDKRGGGNCREVR